MPGPEKIKLQCVIYDIRFDTQNLENENPGFSVRLETIPDKKESGPKLQKIPKQIAFQFSYDPIYK